MTMGSRAVHQNANGKSSATPCLKITRLGIVSRNYQHKFANGYRDFSHTLSDILKLLDSKGCDAVLFSLFTIVPRLSYDLRDSFIGLDNINVVFLEEFEDGNERIAKRYVVYYRTKDTWEEYDFSQKFATTTGMKKSEISRFVSDEMPRRVLGNCCVLICGETNGVRYSPDDKNIHDVFGLRKSIPQHANIILNPIHDYMTRFEMKLKRQFLSENSRWVISVWNRGKKDRNGKGRDTIGPAWTAYFNGKEFAAEIIRNTFGIDIGIIDIGST